MRKGVQAHTTPESVVVKDNLLCLLKHADELDIVVALHKRSHTGIVKVASQERKVCPQNDIVALQPQRMIRQSVANLGVYTQFNHPPGG